MEEKEALGHELAELVNTTEIRRFLQNKTIEELRAKLAEFSSCDGYCADDGDFHHFLSRNSNVRRKVYHREGE
jgi:iron only hydrogenase large subunit-like protein